MFTLYDFYDYTSTTIKAFGRITLWPVYSIVKNYVIGQSDEYLSNPDVFRKKLFLQAHSNSTGVATVSLGKLGGNISVVIPPSQEHLTTLIDTLDDDPKARHGHAAFGFFAGSSSIILSADGKHGVLCRKQLVRFLVPGAYIQPVISEIHRILHPDSEYILREMVCGIIRSVLMRMVLGVEHLPDTAYELMSHYRHDIRAWGAFPMPGIFKYVPKLREKRAIYSKFAQEILDGEFEKVYSELQKGLPQPENQNLILRTLVDLIRQDYPGLNDTAFIHQLRCISRARLAQYYKHESIKALPMLLKAADNLTDALSLCFEKLAADPNALQAIRHELLQARGWQDGDYAQLLKLRLLNAWYQECLRVESVVTVPRYTTKAIRINGVTIPPHTTILLDFRDMHHGTTHWRDPGMFRPCRFMESPPEHTYKEYPFEPFSVGKRMCPAFKLTEYLFKVFVATVVGELDFTYRTADEEKYMMFTSIREHMEASETAQTHIRLARS